MIIHRTLNYPRFRIVSIAIVTILAFLAPVPVAQLVVAADLTVEIGSQKFLNKGLIAAGRIPANQRDKFGETFGSGSGMSVDRSSWKRTSTGFQGNFVLLPDRGYNVEGTADYRARVNMLTMELVPHYGPTPLSVDKQQSGVQAMLTDSLILTDSEGAYMTGLDPEGIRGPGAGFPALPIARNGHVSLDPEAIVRMSDGSYFISDEYGPYIYRFSPEGKMLSAIRPPVAFIPIRKAIQNFSSNNPGPGASRPDPLNPESGRQNNQGFEGMSVTPDGSHLVVVLQSATRQDGGDNAATRRHTRMLFYDIRTSSQSRLVAEYVVPLPTFKAGTSTLVAAQSELVALGPTKFLLLARDSNNGYGFKSATSIFRKILILDTEGATNIAGSAFDGLKPIAPKGVLDPTIKPVTLTPFIDLNDNAQLNRFGLHSGEPNDRNNLSEKWEAISLVSVLDPAAPDDYFMFVVNDNDFITQDGFQVGAPYKDSSGVDIDTTILVYRVTLPSELKPY